MVSILRRLRILRAHDGRQTHTVDLHQPVVVDVNALAFVCAETYADVDVAGAGFGVELFDRMGV